MSDDRKRLHDSIGDFGADEAMYQGAQLPDDFFDNIDDSSVLLKEVDDLKRQLAERESQQVALDDMVIGRFSLTPTGLVAPDDATPEEFAHVGQMLFRLEGSLQWLIGDWLVLVDGYKWGETGALALHFGRKPQTLYNLKLVAKNVQIYLRKENLSYGHHAIVAGMSADQQTHWLDMAEQGDPGPKDDKVRIMWSIARLRAEIKKVQAGDLLGDGGEKTPKMLDFRQKLKEIKKMEKIYLRAGQGDEKAKMEVLGRIAKHRAWLDELEDGLVDD